MISSLSFPFAYRGITRVALLAVFAVAMAVSTGYASALQSDRDQPINFSGDTGNADLQTRGGALSGNVIITQGTLSIRADRIVFKQNADNSLSATAYGNPVAFRQKRDGVDEYYEAYAQRIEYDGSKEFIELFDKALLRRGQDEIRSNYISYSVQSELFRAEGRASTTPDPEGPGARVRGMFQPQTDAQSKKDGGKAPAKSGASAAPAAAEPAVTLKPAGNLGSSSTK